MPHDLSVQIREKLAAYLAGMISLRSFQKWFSTATWDIERTAGSTTKALAYEIELRLAEYTSHHRTKQELQGCLLRLMDAPPVTEAQVSFTSVTQRTQAWFNVSSTSVARAIEAAAASFSRSGSPNAPRQKAGPPAAQIFEAAST